MFPPFDARDYGKMLARVFLRQDAGSRFVQPLVATCVIEMPVGVYELFHGIGINARQCFGNVWMRGDDFSIDKQLSVGPGKNGDIPPTPKRTLYCGGAAGL